MKKNGILIIDDEEMLRVLMADFLEAENYQVFLAESGKRGVELFKQYQGELLAVLLDSNMPEMNGEQTLDELRKLDASIPIFFATGLIKADLFERLKAKGINGILKKPYNLGEFIEMLAKL
ncbi:MAG: response regulator [Chloroherpetonaceae bacterium]|nr:response regulator [Chloroherpetonaceae bacterium]